MHRIRLCPLRLGASLLLAFAPILPLSLGSAASSAPPPDVIYSRVLGCFVGNSIGDAFGAVVEFAEADRVRMLAGSDWVDRFLPYGKDHKPHPWGVWEAAAPRGAGTDDTRINQAFVDCVIRNGGAINAQLLAIEYIERYRDRERLFPRHVALAEEHGVWFYARACERLGMPSLPSGRVIEKETEPTLMGLISLAPAGLLRIGEPEAAYRLTHDLDFVDIGSAVDATAMMAAMVSTALGGKAGAKEMVRLALTLDPKGYGSDRPMAKGIRRFIEAADRARSDRELVQLLAAEVKGLGVFHPLDALGVAAAALYFTDGDPVRTIVIAANDRDVDDQGRLVKLRDVDCSASVAGALVGALRGIEAFPADWVKDTIEANRRIYGIDFEANARRFAKLVDRSGKRSTE